MVLSRGDQLRMLWFSYLIIFTILFNNKQNFINIFIDFHKPFDTINHDILLRKLMKYGIRRVPLRWGGDRSPNDKSPSDKSYGDKSPRRQKPQMTKAPDDKNPRRQKPQQPWKKVVRVVSIRIWTFIAQSFYYYIWFCFGNSVLNTVIFKNASQEE